MANVLDGKYHSSFSGTDITAVFGDQIIGELQAISFSVSREKGPVYTMRGGPSPLAFARGKRATAGTLIFVTIDEAALIGHFKRTTSNKAEFYANKNEIRYNYTKDALFDLVTAFDTVDLAEGPGSERQLARVWYADQLLPFDVNISAANEVGKVMKKTFIGVEILNEGGGISIDDLVIEEQYTYIARDVTPWTKVDKPNRIGGEIVRDPRYA